MIYSLGNLRNTLHTLKVGFTDAKNISDILQCDVLHKSTIEGSEVSKISSNHILILQLIHDFSRNGQLWKL